MPQVLPAHRPRRFVQVEVVGVEVVVVGAEDFPKDGARGVMGGAQEAAFGSGLKPIVLHADAPAVRRFERFDVDGVRGGMFAAGAGGGAVDVAALIGADLVDALDGRAKLLPREALHIALPPIERRR